MLPFSELYFRAFALPAFAKRYSGNMAVFLAAALYALVLGTPVLLNLVIGVLLGLGFLRSRSGLYVMSAQLVLQLGIVLLQIVSPASCRPPAEPRVIIAVDKPLGPTSRRGGQCPPSAGYAQGRARRHP